MLRRLRRRAPRNEQLPRRTKWRWKNRKNFGTLDLAARRGTASSVRVLLVEILGKVGDVQDVGKWVEEIITSSPQFGKKPKKNLNVTSSSEDALDEATFGPVGFGRTGMGNGVDWKLRSCCW